MNGGSGGAASASGGATGSGGSGTGGNTSGLILGMGGPYPFPQNKKPPHCALTTVANASSSVQAAYTSWKNNFVVSYGAGLRVRWPNSPEGDVTVSEGIAYGMLAAVHMGDRATFDGLWTYAKGNFDSKGLMNWKLNASGAILGAGSASDADGDLAWALIMASNQWSSATYLSDARKQIEAMRLNSIGTDGTLKPGDNWGGTALTNPSYFSPAYFRVFAVVANDPNWSGAILNRNYDILTSVSGTNGLVPDWTNNTAAVNQGFLMGGMFDSSTYGYDATRTPWRIALDYCWNNEPRAQAYLMKIGAFFNGVGAMNIGDGYAVSGSPKSNNKNLSFIGPAGVSGMAGFQKLLDDAFMLGVQDFGDHSYFPESLRVLSMLMMSGNYTDFTKP